LPVKSKGAQVQFWGKGSFLEVKNGAYRKFKGFLGIESPKMQGFFHLTDVVK
jgi:hypothetical protein